MPRLYMLTMPGLQVKSDWVAVHDRLLDEFPEVTDVLPTTITATLLIVYEGEAKVDAWLEGISEAVLGRRISAAKSSAGTVERGRTRARHRGRERVRRLSRVHGRAQ
jgi:hypothetical protein